MAEVRKVRLPPSLAAHADFAVHVVVGMVSFSIVYGVALLASVGFERLNAFLEAPSWLRLVGAVVEAAVFMGDVIGLVLLLGYETAKLARRLSTEWRQPHGRP